MLRLFFILSLFTSCAQTSYLYHQGIGQLALEWNGRDIDDVLKDQSVSSEIKNKIIRVQKAKKYFFEYFNLKPTGIYDEITFLKDKAVTYLVTASPKKEVKAVRFSFPFVGAFPYIGFFDKSRAAQFAKEKNNEGYSTYIRPVYAYSTLDKWIFYDNILTSFFELNDQALDQLVFHELFHTVLFVKNEVGLNENLANFFADELYVKYANISEEQLINKKRQKEKMLRLNNYIVTLVKDLSKLYKSDDRAGDIILSKFLENTFRPQIKDYCKKNGIKSCWPLRGKWNNARFAGFNTYSEKRDHIARIFKNKNLSLKDFFDYIKSKEKTFNGRTSFIDHLEK